MPTTIQRIWKYRLHYLIVMPALLLLFIFKGIPFIEMIYSAFVDYQFMRGLWSSEWVGLENFRALFHNPAFGSVLRNTLIMKLGYTLISGITAIIAALALSCIKSRKYRSGLAALFLAPYFIPSVLFAYLVMVILSPTHSPFGSIHTLVLAKPEWFRILFIAIEVIKTCGIPIMLALAAIGAAQSAMEQGLIPDRSSFSGRHVIPALQAVGAFMLMQLSSVLSQDQELLRTLVNPLVFQTGDALSTYSFRLIYENLEVNLAGPLGLFSLFVQLAGTLLAYFILRRTFARTVFAPAATSSAIQPNRRYNVAGIVIGTLLALVVAFVLYMFFVYPFTARPAPGPGLGTLLSVSNYARYLLLDLAAVIPFMLITVTLAFPLTIKDFPGRGLYKLLLLVLLVAGNGTFYEFVFFKDLHMLNTVFPMVISGFFSILPIFILKSIASSRMVLSGDAEGKGELHKFFYIYLPVCWRPLLALGALHFVLQWNSVMLPITILSNPSMFPPLQQFMMAYQSGIGMPNAYSPAVLLQFGAIIMLPSLVVLLAFRKWLTADVLTSQVRNL
ncbi:ABC-type polysaccharide transport system permease subunit [Paenibacillus taihuensis]|uniref:ABC-type polysaccharide transport system permease subunit n=1 Tax=Paenibacillus taihuensis TaxID=1156355 RepID=A0A3D9RYD6_9BACL|nr:hypothetical protein [Paenibacillus taihuensis]REE84448.1 ABC-type polysaccharide transport system permease subunit [Paenibacillus taihuensis]